jgi:hypothetical protein
MQAFLRPLFLGTVPGAPAVGTSSGDSPRNSGSQELNTIKQVYILFSEILFLPVIRGCMY